MHTDTDNQELGDKHKVKAYLNCSSSTLRRYRDKHWIEGVHWFKINSRTVRYNLYLIKDWLENRHDPTAHNQAITRYKKSKVIT